MNYVALLLAIFAAFACATCSSYGSGSSYGGASIPAPPCPQNYLFSCQPNLRPAPCAQQAASYGSAGAYTENVPTYVGAPQQRSESQYGQYYNIHDLRAYQNNPGYQF